jgi:RNA polymerase sigma-70 factor (ECF subfamily)
MDTIETERFEALTAPYRRELFAHCYRMTGSVHDAEDLVQETYVRAWRAFDRFEQRSSVRTWMYRIATNACLTAIDRRRRRPLPSALGAPSNDPYSTPAPADPDVRWLEPVPDHLVVDERGDPADVAAARQSVRLALVAALQLLPARQRAALILCEVLAWPAADAAALLQVSTPAVKSLLQRARARLAAASPTDDGLTEPTDPGARRVLDAYMDAFERSDIDAMERLLADDAVLEMTGTTTWFAGKATCLPFIATQAIGAAGEWRLLPIRANGQVGAATYRLGDDGRHHAFAIVVLATTSSALRRITLFGGETSFHAFELPEVVPPG